MSVHAYADVYTDISMHGPFFRYKASNSSAQPGWDASTMDHMLEVIRNGRPAIPEQEKYGTLSFDEMKIQNGIMWSMSTGLFSGWTETSPFEDYENIKDVLGDDEDLCPPPVELLSDMLASQMLQVTARRVFSIDPIIT